MRTFVVCLQNYTLHFQNDILPKLAIKKRIFVALVLIIVILFNCVLNSFHDKLNCSIHFLKKSISSSA